MDNIKTLVFLAALTALMLVIGYLLAGVTGIVIALGLGIAMNFSAYWYSDKMVLKMYKAQPLPEDHFVYAAVKTLAEKANTPIPKVYLIETEVPNAFATGRNPEHAAVAVTSGLLQRMSQEEIVGVLGHELCHVLHRDTFISVVAATIAGAISGIANIFMFSGLQGRNGGETGPAVGLLMMLLAPAAAGLIQMAISRSREFEADKGGAELTGKPLWLASALARLEEAAQQTPFPAAERHPATAHLFIINPLSNAKLKQLFTTHPPTKERIARLQEMAQRMQ